jgi:hypothetical protein
MFLIRRVCPGCGGRPESLPRKQEPDRGMRGTHLISGIRQERRLPREAQQDWPVAFLWDCSFRVH